MKTFVCLTGIDLFPATGRLPIWWKKIIGTIVKGKKNFVSFMGIDPSPIAGTL